MKSLLLAIAASSLLVACALPGHPTEIINEGGRFSQVTYRGVPIIQTDWPTPQECAATLRSMDSRVSEPGMGAKCALNSDAANLPFAGKVTDNFLNKSRDMHFAGPAMCAEVREKAESTRSSGKLDCIGPKK